MSGQGVGQGSLTNPNGIIIHELAHNLFGPNNFHTSGGHHYGLQPYTTFLGIQGGYGLMGSAGAGLTSVNGYERYRMGWYSPIFNVAQLPIQANNVASDVAQVNGTQSFVLRDFVTTGDAIRIKLPYKDVGALDQFIWLENHKIGTNAKLDYLQFSDSDPQCRSNGSSAVYAYMQIGKDILESNSSTDVYPSGQADNLKVISAEGNFDHVQLLPNEPINCVTGPTSETYQQIAENPLTGDNDQMNIFYNSSVLDLNNSNGHAPFIQHRLNGNVDADIPYLGDKKDAFVNGRTMEIGSNPSPVSLPTFYYQLSGSNFIAQLGAPNNRHSYLTGLKISFAQLAGNDYQVNIVWNDYDVKNDVRWCGDIILKEQVNLKTNKIITLDQSRTANQISRDAVSGEFTPITNFTCEGGSTFHVEQNAQVIVQNKSVLKLQTGSLFRIETGAIVRVKTGSKLILEPNSTLENNGGRIIIEDGASLEYTEASINLITTSSTLEIAGLLDLKAPVVSASNTFTFTGNGVLIFNSPQVPANNVICASNCRMVLQGATFLKVYQDKLRIPANMVDFNMLGGTCKLGNASAIELMGSTTQVSVFYTTITSTTVAYNSHKGLQLKGNPGVLISSNFFNGYYGVLNTVGLLQAGSCNFENCGFGLYLSNGSVVLSGCVFDHNTAYGVSANNMTQPSTILNSTIQNTTGNGFGIYYDGGITSPLTIEGNTIINNKYGIQVKNAKLSGPCNHVNNNQTYGIYATQGATIDFAGTAQTTPRNDFSNNPYSLKVGAVKNIFLVDGYNNLVPLTSGTQKALNGAIQKTCIPPPTAVNALHNDWNANGTFSSADYSLTTTIGSQGCTSAIPVTVTDVSPIAFSDCGSSSMMATGNPLYNCSSCDNVYTANFNAEKLNDAAVEAIEKGTVAGGNDFVESVELLNEVLMFNVPNPDLKEKYVLNYSYAKMGDALGEAFKTAQLTEIENSVTVSDEVQKTIDVANKQIAEALASNNYLDRYYGNLDKVNIYRLAGRRDIAFYILSDMYVWTQPDEMPYLDYKNCMTHLEQDYIDGLLTSDEYIDATTFCESGTNNLRVATSGNTAHVAATNGNSSILRQTNEGEQLSSSITVSPNPATNKLSIYNAYNNILTILIKDIYGKIIYTGKANSLATIDCTSFARGVYAIHFSDEFGNSLGNSKVVLQ